MPDPASIPATHEAIFGMDAVGAALADHAAINGLREFITNAKWDRGELTLTIAPENIVAATVAARAAGYNFFEDCTAVDWYPAEPRFQVTYHFISHRLKQRVRLIVFINGDNPTIDSITPTWPAANFYEREVYDLFGITFAGHPRLTRIMMPDNWSGHPLRKDYPVEGYR